jgi:nucleoside-diphosphate-sugar epimerase
MRVCITGSLGFLGALMTEYLIIRGHTVLGIDNGLYLNGHIGEKLSKMYGKNRYQHFNLDVTQDFQKVGNVIKTSDVLIPLAALVGQPACDKYPELAQATNVDAIREQLRYCENQMVIFPNTNSGAVDGPDGYSD